MYVRNRAGLAGRFCAGVCGLPRSDDDEEVLLQGVCLSSR
jgi:hypothetical protein